MSDYYVRLGGDHWASRSDGYLAVEIIAGLVLLSCLFFVRSFTWLFRGATDRLRTYIFLLSTVATILYFILDLSNLGEDEKDAIVSIKYYVLFIFIQLFSQISEFAILFVILRTVNVSAFLNYGDPGAHQKARIATLVLLGIVGLVSLTTFGLITGYYAAFANVDFDTIDKIYSAVVGVYVSYYAVYFATSLYIIVIAAIGVARQRSKASFITLIVAVSLVLRSLVLIADVVVDYYSHDLPNRVNLDWANSFIYNVTIIVIYAGLTGVAYIGSGFNQMRKPDPVLELAPFATPHVYE